ncbi:MAG TPA: ABC transporter substrate-binding protein [Candidatus Saccharimonadales bacterium]|nr:ABC transporter substrate-binding protein [Candidatus Saccharimonadales bacterium]
MATALIVATCTAPDLRQEASLRPSASPVVGGRFVEGGFSDVRTLQPVLLNDAISANVAGRIYESLVRVDPRTGEIKPNLGSWSVSTDGRTYTWEIARTASWSDGKPIVANDLLTGITLVAKSKRTVWKPNFADVLGFPELASGTAGSLTGFRIDPTDQKKFSVTFGRVFCPALMNAFGGNFVLPTQVFGRYATAESRDEIDVAPENDAPTVASGPFKLGEWKKGDQVVLERNANYWRGAPLLDQYVYKVVADSTVLAQGLKSGRLTYATIEAKDHDELVKVPALRVTEYPQLSESYIGWNVKSPALPALGDKRIRQALAYGLDLDLVIGTALLGHGTKLVTQVPTASWAAPRSGLEPYAFDRAKAEGLIRAAGYAKGADGIYEKEGRPLAISLVANESRDRFLQIVVEQYRAIGVRVAARVETFELMADQLQTGSQAFQAWILGWTLPVDPDPYTFWSASGIPDAKARKTGYNFGSFTSPELEQAMTDGRTPANGDCSLAARKKAYEAVYRILNDEQPYNFGYSPNVIAVTQRSLREFAPDTFGTYWNIEKWWLQP